MLTRIGLDTGQSWRDLARWNNLANPNHLEVGQVLRVVPPPGDVAPGTTVATTTTTTTLAAAAPAATLSRCRRPGQGRGKASGVAAASAPPPPPCRYRRRHAAARRRRASRRRPELGLARGRPGRRAVRRRQDQGPGHRRQGRRPGLRRGRRPRGLRRLGPARLRQPDHRQAQRHLPVRLRPQPGAAGQGGPDGQRGQKIAEMGSTDADRVQLHFEIRSRASPSIRPSCCRRADPLLILRAVARARLAPVPGRRAAHEAALAPPPLYQPGPGPRRHHVVERSCATASSFAASFETAHAVSIASSSDEPGW